MDLSLDLANADHDRRRRAPAGDQLHKAPNGRRSSACTSRPFHSAATHPARPSRTYPAGHRQERPWSSAMIANNGAAARHTQSAAPRTTAAGHSSRVPIVCVVSGPSPFDLVPEPSSCTRAASSIATFGLSGTRIIELPVVLDPEVRIRTRQAPANFGIWTTGCREIDWQRLSKGESYKCGGS